MISVVPSCAVTTTLTVLVPSIKPVEPVTSADAFESVGVATTVTDVTPAATLIVSPETFEMPLTVKVAVASVSGANGWNGPIAEEKPLTPAPEPLAVVTTFT